MGGELDRLRWRCRRGLLELDLVLNRFLERHLATLDAEQRLAVARLLDTPDTELWDMVSGRRAGPDAAAEALLRLMR